MKTDFFDDSLFIISLVFSTSFKNYAPYQAIASLVAKYNKKTFHLQNWKELDKNILFGNNVAGITAGASTPQWIIDDFVENLRRFDSRKK